ncbi:MAG: folylpolyglutamate synthase/dihydrofolate synthase family protein [Pyrinomonadaceae bacterium]
MDFATASEYLLSLGNEVSAMKLGLENIRTLLTAFGNPQNKYLKVQVAGTNGKGSVCAFLDSICVHAGIKTGLYTSPHLMSITERIKIDGKDISDADFAKHATHVRETVENLLAKDELAYRPTFFEQVTAIALVAFAEAKVELSILETGLGGRLDATTAANAEIVAITRIDLDHQEYLGETIEEIAAEKAAIIREGSKVVIAEQKEEARRVIRGRCFELGVEPNIATTDVVTKKYDDEPTYPIRSTTFKTAKSNYPRVVLGLLGKHQEENAAAAIAVAEELRAFGFEISDDEICMGLETARHRGRLEFDDGFLFDGAHNAAGAKALRYYLDEFVRQPITMIFGSMKGKDIAEIGNLLFPKAETLILTIPNNSRAMTATELTGSIPIEFNRDRLILTDSVEEALTRAEKVSNHSLILITGSLYLVGEAQKILKTRSQI